MCRLLRHVVMAICLGLLFVSTSLAEVRPHICIGFNPDEEDWGFRGISHLSEAETTECPPGYAYYGVDKPRGKRREGKHISLNGTCCKTPDGLLTEDVVYEETECPANYVVTGVKPERVLDRNWCRENTALCEKERMSLVHYIRCTAIDEKRFYLGEAQASYAWGFYHHFRSFFDKRTNRAVMPMAIRFGIGRVSQDSWEINGCVGYPWGSLFVKKNTKYCSGLFTRQVLYKGSEGDPPSGTPVQMYPDCIAIDDPYSQDAECIGQ